MVLKGGDATSSPNGGTRTEGGAGKTVAHWERTTKLRCEKPSRGGRVGQKKSGATKVEVCLSLVEEWSGVRAVCGAEHEQSWVWAKQEYTGKKKTQLCCEKTLEGVHFGQKKKSGSWLGSVRFGQKRNADQCCSVARRAQSCSVTRRAQSMLVSGVRRACNLRVG